MNGNKDWAALVGRILLAVVFIPAGFSKIGGFAGTAGHAGRRSRSPCSRWSRP